MYRLLKPVLFALSPETAHGITLFFLDLAAKIPLLRSLLKRWFLLPDSRLERQLLGLRFPNPVGLAAGFDKNGSHIPGLACLGFGFVEVGTVTPRPQAGNPRPRLFRLPADRALINRMGFNNEGVDALAARLQRLRERGVPENIVIGGNIGKNKATPNEQAVEDYLCCFNALFPYVDYFVVNVSSPNTPGLRALQDKEPLTALLQALQDNNQSRPEPKPLLLKIAPDLTDTQLDDIAEIVRQTQLSGIIATNTTISRDGLETAEEEINAAGAGGLSGAPVRDRSTAVIRYLRKKLGQDILIIGVGGIDSYETAREKMEAGANLVQVYSCLVYEGPGLIRRILSGMLDSH
ncbi:MAG: quinone-dependent dihydroorotate dehydrogenase [Bacteroidetes bacterium]|nr:MAG: quinone-dependent dihydroorotate dehydrogenase [Bacteroidota bacterium]